MSVTASSHAVRYRLRRLRERAIELLLFLAAFSSIAVTIGIVGVLLYESAAFFRHVSLLDFLTDPQWTPLFDDAHYGIMPLLAGTLVTTAIALLVAIPVGTVTAIYISEYASHRAREIVKPAIELLSAVPMHIREGSYAMGATRLQTALRVVVPSALSGIAAAYILGISRAIGETMVVAIAAGMQPNLSWNPMEPAETITAYIVQVSLGDLPHGTIGYQTIFAAGLTLLLMTLVFNIAGYVLRKRFRQAY